MNLPCLSYKHNTLITLRMFVHVSHYKRTSKLQLGAFMVSMQAGNFLMYVLRVVSVLWLSDELGICLFGCLVQLVFNTKTNHCLSSLSATKVTTLHVVKNTNLVLHCAIRGS